MDKQRRGRWRGTSRGWSGPATLKRKEGAERKDAPVIFLARQDARAPTDLTNSAPPSACAQPGLDATAAVGDTESRRPIIGPVDSEICSRHGIRYTRPPTEVDRSGLEVDRTGADPEVDRNELVPVQLRSTSGPLRSPDREHVTWRKRRSAVRQTRTRSLPDDRRRAHWRPLLGGSASARGLRRHQRNDGADD